MDSYRAHNWHCFGGPESRALRRDLHDARAAPTTARSAASRRRSRAARSPVGLQRVRRTATASGVRSRVVAQIDTAGPEVRRPEHQDRRRDVRAESGARPRHLRPHHRARLRSEHLGLRARRHRQGRYAGQAQARRVQLAGPRHRGGQRTRARRRAKGLRCRTTSSKPSKRSGPPASTSSATTSSACPRTTTTRMQATLDLALELNCEFANFYSAMAYPGSPLYEHGPGRRGGRCRRTGAATRSTPSIRCRCRRSMSPRGRCCGSGTERSRRTSTARVSGYGAGEVRRGDGGAHPGDDGTPTGEEARKLGTECSSPGYWALQSSGYLTRPFTS